MNTNKEVDIELENTPGFYSIIPATVRYDERLSPSEILLYGDISALCKKEGYCWASNNYFAKLWKKNKVTISGWISNLRNCGHIRTEIIYKDGTKEIERRHIYITKE